MKEAGKANKRLDINKLTAGCETEILRPSAIADIYLLSFPLLSLWQFIHVISNGLRYAFL